jgi:glutaredoxin
MKGTGSGGAGILVAVVAALMASAAPPAAAPLPAQAQGVGDRNADIILFTHVTCPYCADAKRWVEDLQRREPGLTVWVRELSQDRRAGADLQALARSAGVRSVSVPAWVIGGEVFMVGFAGPAVTGRQIERVLEQLGLPRATASGAPAGESGDS